jgi:broad specificity phosphatase PhoE
MAAKRRTIYLRIVQCPDTTWTEQDRIYGATDLPLSEVGRTALAEDIANLQPGKAAVVHHPGDEAAAETAAAFATALKAKVRVVPELSDPNLGILEGMTQREFAERFCKRHKQWHEDPLSVLVPEGEDFITARTRVFDAIVRILRRSRSEEVVIVLHALATGFLKCWLTDRPSTDLWRLLEARPRVERFAIEPEMIDALEQAVGREVAS